ncbi:MAG: YebC/PmpR family DNA-binding transcriptional regulator [Nitrospirae bacterium]|nr:YebC/PmpR family DNA-binding transcriptional regulator [Nitrospirota bacterium]
MSGHSKWSQIKRKKATVDSKRGKIFSKIVKELSVAARMGGADPEGNSRLRTVMEKAKIANMPMENVKRAIQKGAGELGSNMYEEILYEGYGPGGVAILIEALTDNKNRTVAEVRYAMSKYGATLGEAGCVAWMFQKKGYILVDKKSVSEDTLMSIALDAGADDMKNDPKEDNYEIITPVEELSNIKSLLEKSSIPVVSAEVAMIPSNYITIEPSILERNMRIIDVLEELDDVQNVYANFELTDEVLSSI